MTFTIYALYGDICLPGVLLTKLKETHAFIIFIKAFKLFSTVKTPKW